MSRRSVPFVKGGVLLAALLLSAPQVLAGDRVRAARHPATQPQPVALAAVRTVSAPVIISIAAVEATPAETAYLNLRGPDGQLRRFAVEGGREALSSRVVVLRPGESLTLRLAAAK